MLERTWQWVTTLSNHPQARMIGMTLLYVAILLALLALYGKGDFSTPPFIYQGY
ncbi:MAG TPA: teichoic acid D-Ala incorporation-associated protein DltX [Anaerolineae bacterium]|nr:teichoic acid D-Ala incorporation-associated protein DltX [Anaerolineae bacterium]